MRCIEFINLHKTYRRGDVKALDGVHLRIDRGSFFGLIGPNGAGKTTLIELLAGLKRQNTGQVFFFDREITPESFAHRRRMGFVLDQPLYFDRLTCREFLRFVGVMYDLPKADVNNRVDELIRFFDLTEAADRFIETYSKGMKQKVSLAAAILHEPVLLVLDEPFDGIDAASAEEIRQLLLRMNGKGVTILITSHVLELIESLCTECAILHRGRIVFQSRMDELEMQLQRSGDNERRTSLRDVFLRVTSADRPHKSLSWL